MIAHARRSTRILSITVATILVTLLLRWHAYIHKQSHCKYEAAAIYCDKPREIFTQQFYQ